MLESFSNKRKINDLALKVGGGMGRGIALCWKDQGDASKLLRQHSCAFTGAGWMMQGKKRTRWSFCKELGRGKLLFAWLRRRSDKCEGQPSLTSLNRAAALCTIMSLLIVWTVQQVVVKQPELFASWRTNKTHVSVRQRQKTVTGFPTIKKGEKLAPFSRIYGKKLPFSCFCHKSWQKTKRNKANYWRNVRIRSFVQTRG